MSNTYELTKKMIELDKNAVTVETLDLFLDNGRITEFEYAELLIEIYESN